jgi:hypothetical protein
VLQLVNDVLVLFQNVLHVVLGARLNITEFIGYIVQNPLIIGINALTYFLIILIIAVYLV